MGNTQASTCVSVIATGDQESPWAVRRCPGYADGVYQNPPELQTMQDCLVQAYNKYPNNPYCGTRRKPDGTLDKQFNYITYAQTKVIDDQLGSGLMSLGLKPQDFFGIFAENRPEWLHAIDISSTYGLVLVALYDTFGTSTLSTIINHSAIETLLVSQKNVDKIIPRLENDFVHLKRIVLITDPWVPYTEAKDKIIQYGREFYTFQEICELGAKDIRPYPKVDPEWIHYICYSSGTTGSPKGVIVSHRSQTSNTLDCWLNLDFHEDERHLSYLPLPHVFERIGISITQFVGGRIGFFSGAIQTLSEDMQLCKPTHLSGVPRVIMRIYDQIMTQIKKKPAVVQAAFWGMFYWRRWWLRMGSKSPLTDILIFNTINANLGGCIRSYIIGGAAMDPWVHEFMQFTSGVPFRVGYGLSEIGAGSICNPLSVIYSKPGTVGGPLPNTEVKLQRLEDYLDEEAGEIMVGGQCLCSGYYKDEEATEKLFEENRRWVHTGDVGKWDKEGYLMVVDRIRSIFKLSQGEYVAAELLTQTLEAADIVLQIFVYGDSSRAYLVSIIVPKIGEVAKFLGKEHLSEEEFAAACKTPELRKEVIRQLNQIITDKKLPGYEKVRNVYLEPEEWTMKNDLLTPTFKLKRRQLTDKYKQIIEQLYAEPPQ